MKQESGKDQNHLKSNIVVQSKFNFSKEENTECEEHLDAKNEKRFLEQVKLLSLSHFKFFFVCINQTKVASRVNITSDFHAFLSLDTDVWLFLNFESFVNV